MTQADALTILKTGANVFLTGEPGSGKTHTLREYISYLKEHNIDPAITASTGIAATHISGVTIHSWSGIGARPYISDYEIDAISSTEHVVKKISKAKVLIIDEISMLSGNMLNAIDGILRSIRNTRDPFGGLQVVFVGDFFQLPPVQRDRQEPDFAFASRAWKDAGVVVCYLNEQHRHTGSDLFKILTAARRDELNEDHFEILKERMVLVQDVKNETKLFTHNKDVDALNIKKLETISGKKHVFTMTSRGSKTLTAGLVRGCLSPEVLELKIGAHVMCTKNNPNRGFVNGTLGTVVSFGTNGGYPVIRTQSGDEILIEPASWQIEEDGKVKAEITQVPLRLAWAITVHKSQGMTLPSAAIDLTNAFEYGQGYVALSRLVSLSGLELIGIHPNALRVHPTILATDEYFQNQSAKSEAFLYTAGEKELQSLAEQFIVFCGGSIKKEKRVVKEKIDTYTATYELFKTGISLDKIAKNRGLTMNTILDHIYVLNERGDIDTGQLISIVPPKLAKSLNTIYKAFKECGTEKLAPVYSFLDSKFSYDDLKLARIVYNAVYK